MNWKIFSKSNGDRPYKEMHTIGTTHLISKMVNPLPHLPLRVHTNCNYAES